MKTHVGEVIDFLEGIAPLHLQESFDNSGLLIGSRDAEVTGVLVSLDCTEKVLDEAISKKCNLVISHHPAIFYGVKSLTDSNMTERIIRKAIREDLVIYAIHTNLDNILARGVNERIAQKLGLKVEGILRPLPGDTTTGAGLLGHLSMPMPENEFLTHIKDSMDASVVRHTDLIGRDIAKVAICGGSGSFLLKDAKKAGADALVTADFKYHDFFEADGDILVCDIGHYESEQYTIGLIQELISGKFATFAAHCTEINTNPVHYFT